MEHHLSQINNADYLSAVKVIKDTILKSRYRAAQMVNHEMLALYYGIGGFISTESRSAQWGSGAIKTISAMLKQELPIKAICLCPIRMFNHFFGNNCIFNESERIPQLLMNRPSKCIFYYIISA